MKNICTISGMLILIILVLLSACKSGEEPTPEPEPDPTPATHIDEHLLYIGLKEKTNIAVASQRVQALCKSDYFRSSIHMTGDYLYANTAYGIYRKKLSTMDNTSWDLYGFEGIPIVDFVRKGNSILVATPFQDKRALLLSTDDGKTYSCVTPSSFLDMGPYSGFTIPHIYAISQNPHNPHSLVALVYSVMSFGLLKSTDFGKTWNSLSERIGGYQNWFVGFNPNDTTNIYNTGESEIFNSFINTSYDNGQNWIESETVQNNCVHHIAFHPTNPQTMIYSGEGLLKKSTDKGKTWRLVFNDPNYTYFYKVVYDTENHNILYATGGRNSQDHTFNMFRSTDGGESWDILFSSKFSDRGMAIDFIKYTNKLILYTYCEGICVYTIPEDK